jgi:CRISPR-associated protein Cmr1
MPLPETIVIPIKTLTPIWTGDADGKTRYIKGTSLLGGLRFWTEALVRSFGERVCDITSDGGKDLYDKEKNSRICRVCEIFGCTGKGRSFSLQVQGNGTDKAIGRIKLSDHQYRTRAGKLKTPEWFLQDPGKMGNFKLVLMPMRGGGMSPELALAVVLMLKWGSLGAKDQFGFGFVQPELGEIESFIALAQHAIPMQEKKPCKGLSFQDFFYFAAKPKKQAAKLPFEIRYRVRRSFPETMPLRHYFCGTISPRDKACSKYNIGLADGVIRGWGFFPKDGPFSKDRDTCLDNLKNTLANNCVEDSLLWREFQSKRDPKRQDWNWPQFLKELLEGGIS